MKAIFFVVMSFLFAGIVSTASAQGASAVVVAQTDAVVKVIKVDRKARTVTARSADGEILTLHVPKEAQNFDRVKEGLFFKMKYSEAVALSVTRGGAASAGSTRTVSVAPKGGTPGGMIVETHYVSGTIEKINAIHRRIALKGPGGNVLVVDVPDDVQGLDQLRIGDVITLEYAEALAVEMLATASAKKAGMTHR